MNRAIKKQSLIPTSLQDLEEHYRFEETVLGEGTYGVVWLGHCRNTDRPVAIKIIPKNRLVLPNALISEIRFMKQTDHVNIAKLYDTYEDSEGVYCVMELCQGGELYDALIDAERFREQDAATLFGQMASAVAYLHSHKIAHRDLKPENFLFGQANDLASLKLIDFGLAESTETEMTANVGSCYYVAPETLRGTAYTEKCDVWSLGVLLYMLLSGYPPFEGDTDQEVLYAVETGRLDFDDELWAGISGSAKNLIERMLNRNPEQRPSAKEVLDDPWLSIVPMPLPLRGEVQERKACKTQLSQIVQFLIAVESTIEKPASAFKEASLNKDPESLDDYTEQMVPTIDTDQSGDIEATAAVEHHLVLSRERLFHVFHQLDVEQRGKIEPQNLQRVFEGGYSFSNWRVWQDMIAEADINSNGSVSFDEFVCMIEKVTLKEVDCTQKDA